MLLLAGAFCLLLICSVCPCRRMCLCHFVSPRLLLLLLNSLPLKLDITAHNAVIVVDTTLFFNLSFNLYSLADVHISLSSLIGLSFRTDRNLCNDHCLTDRSSSRPYSSSRVHSFIYLLPRGPPLSSPATSRFRNHVKQLMETEALWQWSN